MKKFFVLLVFLALTGCGIVRGPTNTAGKITEIGELGTTVVQGVGNAEEPAVLDRSEQNITISHTEGDELVFKAKGDTKDLIETILRDQEGPVNPENKISVKKISPKNKDQIEIVYFPTTGSTTTLKAIETHAATGSSREDTAAITGEILSNTKTIQYVGIALVLTGLGLGFYFRVPMQGGIVSAAGVGLIVLQSTLANPMWSWVILGILAVLPIAWLWHLYKGKSTKDAIIKSIDEFKKKNPQVSNDLENVLSKNMDASHKKSVRNIRTNT